MHKPFFSIVIPTYNRAEDLRFNLSLLLKQTFNNFEIIISDNCSTDNTEQVVKNFKDKRIFYYKNKRNIGAEPNYQKVFSYTRGEYLFTIGDDDFIIFNDTLEKIKKILDKKPLGFIRLNLIEKKFVGNGLRKSIINYEKNIIIGKNSSPERIIRFYETIAAGHIAGLVIKNYQNISVDMIDCQNTPWIKVIYKQTQKFGALYLASQYMVITWSQGSILHHYDVPKSNHLMFEKYTDYIFTLISKNRLPEYKYSFYKNFIGLQPAIKLYSNNSNLLKFNHRLLSLEPKLKNQLLFWLFFASAFFLPKSFWIFVRKIQHFNKNILPSLKKYPEIIARYDYINKMYYN